jgi:uncharacterized protein (TIGR02246 family)
MNATSFFRAKTGLIAFTLFIAAAHPARADDKADILAVLNTEAKGYEVYDAKMASGMFTEDAVWINPFGVQLVGRKKLEHFLTKLFNLPGFRAGKDTSKVSFDVQLIDPNVAVSYGYLESDDQIDDTTGKKIGPRRSHYLNVLKRQDGKWMIVSEMIMDEK